MNTILLTSATLLAGLMAGLFYAWLISVTPGLAQVSTQSYLESFQSMNRAILNPAFFIAFMGQAILLPLATYWYFKSGNGNQFSYILGATLLYWVGCMLVTMFGNVPLNNTLEVLQIDQMTGEQMEVFRSGFEKKWNQFNLIRTISTLLSLLLLIVACLQNVNK